MVVARVYIIGGVIGMISTLCLAIFYTPSNVGGVGRLIAVGIISLFMLIRGLSSIKGGMHNDLQ